MSSLGVMLCVTLQWVPLVVEVCTQVVEECGLTNQGIYRVPGNSLAINNLVEELNRVCMVISAVLLTSCNQCLMFSLSLLLLCQDCLHTVGWDQTYCSLVVIFSFFHYIFAFATCRLSCSHLSAV